MKRCEQSPLGWVQQGENNLTGDNHWVQQGDSKITGHTHAHGDAEGLSGGARRQWRWQGPWRGRGRRFILQNTNKAPPPPPPPTPTTMNTQCLGTTKQNQRCRITRNLDEHSYCEYHQYQYQHQQDANVNTNANGLGDQPPTEQGGTQCLGTTKQNQRCRITRNLDEHSYCEYHQYQYQHQQDANVNTNANGLGDQPPTEQGGTQCLGTTKQNQRCRITRNLDEHSYCEYHQYQYQHQQDANVNTNANGLGDQPPTEQGGTQCLGTTKQNQRCRITRNLDEHSYCEYHQYQYQHQQDANVNTNANGLGDQPPTEQGGTQCLGTTKQNQRCRITRNLDEHSYCEYHQYQYQHQQDANVNTNANGLGDQPPTEQGGTQCLGTTKQNQRCRITRNLDEHSYCEYHQYQYQHQQDANVNTNANGLGDQPPTEQGGTQCLGTTKQNQRCRITRNLDEHSYCEYHQYQYQHQQDANVNTNANGLGDQPPTEQGGTQCLGTTKQNQRCRITRNLDEHSYCEYHQYQYQHQQDANVNTNANGLGDQPPTEQGGTQCLGTTKQNQRCRITRNLDEHSYCEYHQYQYQHQQDANVNTNANGLGDQPPTEQGGTQCLGTTKQNQRCRITRNLDEHSYCEYHQYQYQHQQDANVNTNANGLGDQPPTEQGGTQCLGTTKQNQRCRITRNLDEHSYCEYHQYQYQHQQDANVNTNANGLGDQPPTEQGGTQCLGTTKQNQRCRITRNLDEHSYCEYHQYQYQHQQDANVNTNANGLGDQPPTEQGGTQCLGTTKQNQRCRITRNLDEHSYCEYHQYQYQHQQDANVNTNANGLGDQPPTEQGGTQCLGTTKQNQRCRITRNLDEHSYCEYHQYQYQHQQDANVNTNANIISSPPTSTLAPVLVRPAVLPPSPSPSEDHTSAESDDADSSDAESDDPEASVTGAGDHNGVTGSISLLFDTVTMMGRQRPSTVLRWKIHDNQYVVVGEGTATPGVKCGLPNVIDASNLTLFWLTVTVDVKKERSKPYQLAQLQPSGKVKISASRSVVVRVLLAV